MANFSVSVDFLEKKAGEITAGSYLLSIAESVNSFQHIGTGALLIANNYILGLIWGIDSIHLLDSHSKDENGNLSSSGIAVLLKFDTLHSRKLYNISLSQRLANGSILSNVIHKSSVHCQYQEWHKMFINKGAIIIRAILKCGYYIKNADTKNPENKIIYQKARYQDNCEKEIEYQKWYK